MPLTVTPVELAARAVVFGLLVVAGIAAIVVAGAWWLSLIGALGLLLAVTGLVMAVVALLGDRRAGSRALAVALAVGAVAACAIAVAA
jgi:hypothetical protein